MTGVRVKDGESFENAMKRFKKQCEKAGILSEIRKREHYEKPSVKKEEGPRREEARPEEGTEGNDVTPPLRVTLLARWRAPREAIARGL